MHWNRRKAAQLLGVSYKTLLNKIKETGLEQPVTPSTVGNSGSIWNHVSLCRSSRFPLNPAFPSNSNAFPLWHFACSTDAQRRPEPT